MNPTESKTPRTDAVAGHTEDAGWFVSQDFARTLELELAEANRKLEECSTCHMDKGDVEQLIDAKDRKLEVAKAALNQKIQGKTLRQYMFQQFPATDGHIPFMEFCGRQEQALTLINQSQPKGDGQ